MPLDREKDRIFLKNNTFKLLDEVRNGRVDRSSAALDTCACLTALIYECVKRKYNADITAMIVIVQNLENTFGELRERGIIE